MKNLKDSVVFKKLCFLCKKHDGKNDAELSQILNDAFSKITFYYIYGSPAIQLTKIPPQNGLQSLIASLEIAEPCAFTTSICWRID